MFGLSGAKSGIGLAAQPRISLRSMRATSVLQTDFVWPAFAELIFSVPLRQTRAQPKPQAHRDRHRAAPAGANTAARGVWVGLSFCRAYRRTAACLRVRNPQYWSRPL